MNFFGKHWFMIGFLFLSSVQFASLRSLNSENKISNGVDDFVGETSTIKNQTCVSHEDCHIDYFCCFIEYLFYFIFFIINFILE